MNPLSVIILSKNAANLRACCRAVHEHEEELRIIVITDDGLEQTQEFAEIFEQYGDAWWRGAAPFVFAKNANLGIQRAGRDDVILLNDDALLETPGGFSLMQQASYEHPEYGLIASTCNNVGNANQFRQPGDGLREDPRQVCFVCVLIPRRTIDLVGLLDERFKNYGCEDDDYSLRVRNAGLKIGIHDGCYVDHGSLTSTFRGQPGAGGDFRPNLKLFIEKWGVDNWGRKKEESQWKSLFP